ncbi:MAG: pentapeptide repeat-containing protein [Deltaproteobacteria bacterium]|nr:pentapeptide repeat-containing protein [Deltaproteobacteria bacterium]
MTNYKEYPITGFSSVELAHAKTILRQLDPETFDALDYYGIQANDQQYGTNFNGSKINKCHFKKCIFKEVDFLGTTGASSSFKNCVFKNCNITNACFDFADFSGSEFVAEDKIGDISASGFAHANLSRVKLNGISISACSFENSYFKNAVICDCSLKHCSFENASFEDTSFKSLDLSRTSLDFSTMNRITFRKVTLSPIGILHSFGGLYEVERNAENVTFKFPSSNVELTYADLISKLEGMQAFFFYVKDFFALSALNIYFGNHDQAYQYLGMGLVHSLNYRDFRMIGYYCKLASLNHFFTKRQLINLYNNLRSSSINETMTSHEYNVYLYEMDRIKRMLIDNPFGLPQMKISLITNIDSKEITLISEILEYLDKTIEEYLPQGSKHITLQHNSPFQFEIFLSDSLVTLYECALALSTGLFGLTTFIAKIQKMVTEHHKIKGLKLDNKLKELDIERRKSQSVRDNNYILESQENSLPFPRANTTKRIVSISFSIYTDIELPEELREVTISQQFFCKIDKGNSLEI